MCIMWSIFYSQMRTHAQLFRHLVDDIANTMDDVDHPTLGKGGFVSQRTALSVNVLHNIGRGVSMKSYRVL